MLLVGIALLLFLGLYTWDSRTGYPTKVAEATGLEVVGYILAPGMWVKEQVGELWDDYFALIGVAKENERLKAELSQASQELSRVKEDLLELERLREFLHIAQMEPWEAVAGRVISARFGPDAILETVMINKGFSDGASPGTPVVTTQGLIGKVFRAASRSATVLLVTDNAFRVAVISQETRTSGILFGTGVDSPLEVKYVSQNAKLKQGELLISSGLDGYMPKGIPVAKVVSVESGNEIMFKQVQAVPVVSLDSLEEVLLLFSKDKGKHLQRENFSHLSD